MLCSSVMGTVEIDVGFEMYGIGTSCVDFGQRTAR